MATSTFSLSSLPTEHPYRAHEGMNILPRHVKGLVAWVVKNAGCRKHITASRQTLGHFAYGEKGWMGVQARAKHNPLHGVNVVDRAVAQGYLEVYGEHHTLYRVTDKGHALLAVG